jgi:amino acid transporter
MYLTISGGAYGIEEAVHIGGPGLTLLLCLLVPAMVSLPTALMAAELTALFPLEGGFYVWVKQGLGDFAGFVEAYLTLLYTAVDMALYPVLFASYLSFVLPADATGQVFLAIAMVWACGLLNILGVRPVGSASILLMAVLLAPMAALVVAGLPHLPHWHAAAVASGGGNALNALGLTLAIVIWNFSGWENLSVVAAEIKSAPRTYARAVAIVLPLVVIGYVAPIAVATAIEGDPARWSLGAFATIGARLGGPLLGQSLALGGMVSALAIFQAALLWVSRMPFVMAQEGYLPRALTSVWARGDTPWKAILACCVVCTLLLPLGFSALVLLDVAFYMAALVLELIALIRLRRLRPQRGALFVIGGGPAVLYGLAAAPLAAWVATFGVAVHSAGGILQLLAALLLGLAVWPAYRYCRRAFGGPADD